MSNTANGIVEAISQKEVSTRYGKKLTYSIKLDDGEWYSFGFKDPKAAKGQVAAFEYTESSYGKQGDVKSLSVSGAASAAPPPAASSGGTATRRTGAGGDRGARAQCARHRDGVHLQLPELQQRGRTPVQVRACSLSRSLMGNVPSCDRTH